MARRLDPKEVKVATNLSASSAAQEPSTTKPKSARSRKQTSSSHPTRLGRTKMPSITKAKLLSENAFLRARVAELETKLPDRALDQAPAAAAPPFTSEQQGQALKASEVRYRRLFETAQDAILILDAKSGKIEDANPYIGNLLGYTIEELIGRSLWEIGLFKDINANQVMFQDLKNKGYIRYENLPLQTKSGLQRPVEFVSNIYLVGSQSVIQCNIRDIGERKIAETKAKTIHHKLVALVTELQKNDAELQSLYKMSELLQSCDSQEEAYKVINILGNELFDGQSGCLAMLRPLDQYLEVVVCWGESRFVKEKFKLDDCWALRRGQLHTVMDSKTGLNCQHFTSPIQDGSLCMPLVVQGETMGMISLTCPNDKHQVRRQQLAVIVGDGIKLSLSNLRLREKLREQASTDQLTGLGNRHYLEENLSRELARTLRRKDSVCVAMLDLDNFKETNDKYGHDGGDMILRRLGEVLRTNLRQSDIICRYGGEEFVVVLLDSPLIDVHQRLETVREKVKEIEVQLGKQRFGGITLSIGIVEANESDWTTSTLLRAADDALYQAKRAGRDRIVVYQPAS